MRDVWHGRKAQRLRENQGKHGFFAKKKRRKNSRPLLPWPRVDVCRAVLSKDLPNKTPIQNLLPRLSALFFRFSCLLCGAWGRFTKEKRQENLFWLGTHETRRGTMGGRVIQAFQTFFRETNTTATLYEFFKPRATTLDACERVFFIEQRTDTLK